LKAEHFQSFWYFSSSVSLAIIGIFGAVLCSAAATQTERERYVKKLAEYRWLLRLSANSASFMQYAVGVLDACSQLLEEQAASDGASMPHAVTEEVVGLGDWAIQGSELGRAAEDMSGSGALDDDAFAAFLMHENGLALLQVEQSEWLQGRVPDFDCADMSRFQQTPTK
jgi:hypothetical protein